MSVPMDLERELQNELQPDEKILWEGQPDPKRSAASYGILTLFGIPSIAFGVFWMYTTSAIGSHSSNPQPFFMFFGIPPILFGLAMLLAPLWAGKSAVKTAYAVTNQRAIIISGTSSRTVHSYFARDIGEITRTDRTNGTGDVMFAQRPVGNGANVQYQSVGFLGIPNPREVEGLIRQLTVPAPPTTLRF